MAQSEAQMIRYALTAVRFHLRRLGVNLAHTSADEAYAALSVYIVQKPDSVTATWYSHASPAGVRHFKRCWRVWQHWQT